MTPLACDMSAIPPAERKHHRQVTRRVVTAATDLHDVPDGLTLELPGNEYRAVTEFIAYERLCCPFLRFNLDVEPGRSPMRLRIDGPPGTGAFLRMELGLA